LRAVPKAPLKQPDMQQQMRELDGNTESPEAAAAAAEFMDKLKKL